MPSKTRVHQFMTYTLALLNSTPLSIKNGLHHDDVDRPYTLGRFGQVKKKSTFLILNHDNLAEGYNRQVTNNVTQSADELTVDNNQHIPNSPKDRPHTSYLPTTLIHFIAGGIAGSIAKTAVAPFDRTKILIQTNNQHYRCMGIFSIIFNICKLEGVTKLWTGNGATIIRIFPYAAIQFVVYEKSKQLLISRDDQIIKPTPFIYMICGAISGIVATVITYPLDIIRVRLACQVHDRIYDNTFHGLVTMCRMEGHRTLWKGLKPTIEGIIPYAGINFASFEMLRLYISKLEDKGLNNTLVQLISGALAGIIGQTITYPWDVVRRRYQTAGFIAGVPPIELRGTFEVMKQIVKKDGFFALYKGISINFLKIAPATSIAFTVYDGLKQLLTNISISE